MKKLLIALFGALVLAGCATKDGNALSYEIDPIATANAPWEVGTKIGSPTPCHENLYCDLVYLGTLKDGRVLVQRFYPSGNEYSSPYAAILANNNEALPDGIVTYWYESGERGSEGLFQNGKREGIWLTWHENGQLGIEGNFQNDKKEGPWNMWHENGQPHIQGNFKNDEQEGFHRMWYENGQLYQEGNFANSEFVGLWRVWDENGVLRTQGYYQNGQETGIWHKWDEDGNLIEEIDFGTP